MICCNIVDLTHYLDDFIFWSADYTTCQQTLKLTFYTVGLSTEPSNIEGPSIILTFLSIEIDTIERATSLASKIVTPEEQWANKKFTSKHDLQVIIGLLCDVAQVVPTGRPFIRSLIDAMFHLKAANYLTR